MRRTLVTFVLFGLGAAYADHTVFLTWEGEVSAPLMLRVRGNQVDVDSRNFAAVSGASHRFRESLPLDADIRVNVREGNGTVRILEQPTRRNDDTLVVRINPRDHGTEMYRLEFTADDATRAANRRERRRDRVQEPDRARGATSGEVTWSGRVDNEVVVTLRDRRAIATAVRGRSTTNERVDFSGRMPNGPAQVGLMDTRGRGSIDLLEEPSAANDYAAKVRILDPDSGDSDYQFTLQWDDSSSGGLFGDVNRGGTATSGTVTSGTLQGSRRIVWRGFVDGKVRVSIQANRSWVDRLSGAPVSGARADFGSPLPRISRVDVRKVSGRDDIEIVEEPSAANGYKLVIEIDDDDAGADEYAIEVNW